MAQRPIADFWLDPSCPYTWVTSRWLLEVATMRPVEIRWHVMSLAVLNEGRGDDPEGDSEGYLWIPVRICAAVQQEYGSDALGRLYTTLWTHGPAGAQQDGGTGGPDHQGGFEDALQAAGLPHDLAAAGFSTRYDDAVRASHAEGIALVGPHIGTPIIAVTDPGGERTAFFGPVISHTPRGEHAVRLWEGTLAVAGTRGFHVLKGPPYEDAELELDRARAEVAGGRASGSA